MQDQSSSHSNKILRLKDIALLIGLSPSTLYDKQNPKSPRFDPTFPSKIQLGARAVGWREKDIIEWINSMRSESIVRAE
ncbi:TPA: AlpA family phage regulatory protein [Vibrio parahaemolyticus]|uniref:helix-turn-helix transcriptional regulator n=1 Tax=Vibrio alginolyticus TaxID=663 RepID=UPI0037549995|nr:AlpA family phage regulatory protein [Vibrio parahaemolyticus]HCK0611975.1 AlpA family phage regulatory protein [Vibrio parahaemolyticus]